MRWLVVDCGNWLTGRKVLIHPSAILQEDLERQQFVVALTKAQVKGSPELVKIAGLAADETELYDYYGWDPHWGGANLAGIPGRWRRP